MNDIFDDKSQPLEWHFNRPSARSEVMTKVRRLAKMLNISLHSIDVKGKSYRTMVEQLVELALNKESQDLKHKASVTVLADAMRKNPPKTAYALTQKLRMAM